MLSALAWFVSISKKFYRNVPIRTALIVVLDVLSQIALILAFFLPLKVIILLGSPDMPSYFPTSWQQLEKNDLVILLSVSAALAYLFYVIVEMVVSQLTEQGSQIVLNKKSGFSSVSQQDSLAKQFYTRYVKIISSLAFVTLAVLLIALVYPELLLPLLGYCLLATILYLVIGHTSDGFTSSVAANVNVITSAVGAIGFMAMFGYLVYDFMVAPAPGVIQAVIGLLLVRQIFSRLVVFTVNSKLLYDKRAVVKSLFYQNPDLPEQELIEEKPVWKKVSAEHRLQLASKVLATQLTREIPPESLDIEYIQTAVDGIVGMVVGMSGTDDVTTKYLLKLYAKNRSEFALHERKLLSAHRSELESPWPKFIGSSHVDELIVNIYEWHGSEIFSETEYPPQRVDLMISLLCVKPSGGLEAEQRLMNTGLFSRLQQGLLARLSMFCDSERKLLFDELTDNLEKMRTIYEQSPKQYVNPDLFPHTLMQSDLNNLFLFNWSRWSLEGVGAGWYMHPKVFAKLPKAFKAAQQVRADLARVPLQTVKFNACVFEFEKMIRLDRYEFALDVLPELLSQFRKHK